MFEPVHGSAPDIAGQGMADPTAAILSAGAAARPPRPPPTPPARSSEAVVRRPHRPSTRDHPEHVRDRRRDRRPGGLTGSALGVVGFPASAGKLSLLGRSFRPEVPTSPLQRGIRQPLDSHRRWTNVRVMEISTTLTTDAGGRRAAGRDPGQPRASAPTSPTTWSPSSGHPTQGWHDARVDAVRPAHPRPRDRRPALRAGDLRGDEGLPARRRLDLDVPPRGERRADGALQPPARAAGARARATSCRPSRRSSRSTSAGCPTGGGREEPLPPPVHDRLRDVPRRAARPSTSRSW